MSKTKKFVKQRRYFYRAFVATALLANGVFQFIAPVLAEGTVAGTSISNEATATYEDPNSPGTTINTTSNTVVVTVAEVAGITVTASGVTDATTSATNTTAQVGDLLIYTYTVTNVGNDPTKFRIPNQASTTGPGTVSGVLPNDKTGAVPSNGTLQYSTDGGATWTNVPAGGVDTPSVPVNGTVLVRVPVTVQSGANSNDIITVTLGNTPGDAQNQLRSPDGGDVFTVDNTGTLNGDIAGDPVNGTREASATQDIKVGTTLKTYALATVLKTRGPINNNNTDLITDDKIPYNLSFRVESTDPTGQGIDPAPLVGTSINITVTGDPVGTKYILVSDAIPTDTQLAAVPTAPPGWQAVYTTDPVGIDANAASWTTTAPGVLSSVKRIGFINKPATITSIAPGTTVNGFSVLLAVKSTATSPLTIANIAQLFGQTAGTSTPVYDESGDQNPSNYNGPVGNMTPPLGTDTNTDGIPDALPDTSVEDGFINTPTAPETGTDTGNNNTGTGDVGEANVVVLQTPVASGLINGPQNAPDAVGPTGNNDDFTNKSSLVPPKTTPGSTLDPQSVGFTNTVKNSGTDAGLIKLEPTALTNATDLPTNTKVTISYNSQSAVYNYNGATFTLTSGTTITIPNVAPGASINYGVEVDLPGGTPLSTDILVNRGFPVPITGSIDNYTIDANSDGIKDSGNNGVFDAFNITIDRVYTGFLRLLKFSRVIQGTGTVVGAGQGDFESTPSFSGIDPNSSVPDVARKPAPGNIVEYQIRYKNISEAQAGTGNVILNADKVVITEDGTQTPNNWALDNDLNTQIDTSNVVGTAADSGASTIKFFSGNPANASGIDQTGTTVNTDVTKYVNTVTGQVAPGIQRTFTFQRKVN